MLTEVANVHYSGIGNDCQADGKALASLIFESKVSDNTFDKIKTLVAELNTIGNGINYTGTECKAMVNALYKKGQITETQKKELYKAIGIQ